MVTQKPLRRIDIEEVGGQLTESLVQELVRESTSPSAKMIKMEETGDDRCPLSDPCPPEPSDRPSSTVPDVPPAPTNSFQLEADLRKIGKQPEVIYRYLRVSLHYVSFMGRSELLKSSTSEFF